MTETPFRSRAAPSPALQFTDALAAVQACVRRKAETELAAARSRARSARKRADAARAQADLQKFETRLNEEAGQALLEDREIPDRADDHKELARLLRLANAGAASIGLAIKAQQDDEAIAAAAALAVKGPALELAGRLAAAGNAGSRAAFADLAPELVLLKVADRVRDALVGKQFSADLPPDHPGLKSGSIIVDKILAAIPDSVRPPELLPSAIEAAVRGQFHQIINEIKEGSDVATTAP